MFQTPVPFMVISLVVLAVFFVADIFVIGRKPHVPTTKESLLHILFFVAAALVFGGIMWLVAGSGPAVEFYSGWLTEYSLSVDNLFVFIIIMANFAVPPKIQRYVLSIGITIAIILRAIFIFLGAAIIQRFTWVFFLFGIFLIVTAIKLTRSNTSDEADEEVYKENKLIHFLRRFIPTTSEYDGEKVRITVDGKKLFTPLLIVFLAIGTTDVLFAFDSIPAIFGLTRDPFIVLTTNIFALLGLQQLYFLLGALINKLRYLPIGLAVVLGFIGIKLILEALHDNSLPFINGGQHLDMVPEVPTWLSLCVIVVALGIASLASVVYLRRHTLTRVTDDDVSKYSQGHTEV
jgi:tellurite resistance protein TerC